MVAQPRSARTPPPLSPPATTPPPPLSPPPLCRSPPPPFLSPLPLHIVPLPLLPLPPAPATTSWLSPFSTFSSSFPSSDLPTSRRCARPTSRFTAAKSAPAGAAGHPGQHRAGGASGGDGRDTRDQAARRGIRRNWAGSGTTPVAAVRASGIVRKRAGTASGRRLRSAAVDSFKRDENPQKDAGSCATAGSQRR